MGILYSQVDRKEFEEPALFRDSRLLRLAFERGFAGYVWYRDYLLQAAAHTNGTKTRPTIEDRDRKARSRYQREYARNAYSHGWDAAAKQDL